MKKALKILLKLSRNPFDLAIDWMVPPSSELLISKKINNVNILNAYDPDILAHFSNYLQKITDQMRLGIPINIAFDPRHLSITIQLLQFSRPPFPAGPIHWGWQPQGIPHWCVSLERF